MDIATIIVLGKALLKAPRREVTPPTSEAGLRPTCGLGEKAVHFENPDRWVCVPDFK